MPSLTEQALMLDALSGDMDREFPRSARAFREEAQENPDRWKWCLTEAERRRRENRS